MKIFELNVDGHGRDLSRRLNSARKRWRFCDFVIQAGTTKIPVHRVVLCEASDYFQELFSRTHSTEDSYAALPYAILDGLDPQCLLLCIEYLYTGQISTPRENCLALLHVAKALKLKGLCDEIAAFIGSTLDLPSFYDLQGIASTERFRILRESCDRFATKNFRSIVASDEFANTDKNLVQRLIGTRENQEEESLKCKALMVWGNYDYYNRKDAVEEIFLTLNPRKIPKVYLQYLEENEPLVFNSVPCMRKLFRMMSETEIDDPTLRAILRSWSELHCPWPDKYTQLVPPRLRQIVVADAIGPEHGISDVSANNEQSQSSPSRSLTLVSLMDFCLDISKLNSWRISVDYESQRIWDEIFHNTDSGVLIYCQYQDIIKDKKFCECLKSAQVLIGGVEFPLASIPTISFKHPGETSDGDAHSCSSSRKFFPGFVIWFDNEKLELFAKNFCDTQLEFHHSFGLDPECHSKTVPSGESCAIFSIGGFVDLIQKKSHSVYRLDGYDITTPQVMIDGFTIRITPCMIHRFSAVSSSSK